MNWTDTLNAVLEAGVPTDRFAMFATVDPEGHPRVRSVVVRSLSAGLKPVLIFSADLRSAKMAELANDGRAELGWFLPNRWVQYRLSGRASVSSDEAARQAAWTQTTVDTRGQLLGGAPGTPVETPFEPTGLATDEQPPSNFALIELVVEAVDVVDLTMRPASRTVWQVEAGQWRSHGVHP